MDYTTAFRVDGKVAVVTGAGQGIGAAIATALASCGARVLATDQRIEAGEALCAAIRAGGGEAEFLEQDVRCEEAWERVSAAALAHFGRYDILVNNAGILTASLITQCSLADFQRVQDVNVNGVFLGMKHAIRAMSPGGSCGEGGSIINLSSVAGLIGSTAHVAYHTSKGAVRLMTKAAAIECAALQTGIRVNAVHPGIVDTAMGRAYIRNFVDLGLVDDLASADAAIRGVHPMGYGQVEDIACAVLYLASAASRWVNGAELVLDGGLTAQ